MTPTKLRMTADCIASSKTFKRLSGFKPPDPPDDTKDDEDEEQQKEAVKYKSEEVS